MKSTIIKIVLVLILLSYNLSFAQWTNDPSVNTPVCVWDGFQNIPEIISDNRGGAIIAWLDFRLGNADIFIQRLDAQGFTKWVDGGKAVSINPGNKFNHKIIQDEESGCIVVWEDYRNGNSDIYAQRVDSSGNILWDSAGVAISVLPLDQEDPQIVSDGLGGAIIMWEFKQGAAGETGLYAQRINSLGQVLWAVNGVPVVTSPSATPIQILPQITGDGAGGAVIAWIENTLDEYISAQRINSAGIILWPQNGLPICTSSLDKRFQNIINVGNGEFVLCWNEEFFFNEWDLRAQKFDTTGNIIWNNEGIVICSSDVSINKSAIGYDNQNSVIIGWEDRRSNPPPNTIYCQKLSLDGITQWQQNGIPVSNLNGFQAQVKIVCDSNGNTIVSWQDARDNPLWDIYAQKIDGSGNRIWEQEGKAVSIATGLKSHQNIIITNNEDYIVSWGDERNPDPDIYAQSLDALVTSVNHSTAELPELFVLNQNYPNPFNPSTIIKFSLPVTLSGVEGSLVTLKIYNTLGEEVVLLLDKKLTTGAYEVEWIASGMPSGVYFYQLKTEGFVEIKKMVFLK